MAVVAPCDRDLAGEAPDWVHLFPLGHIGARDGRQFNLVNPEAVIAAFDAGSVDLPIDYEHQNDRELTMTGPVPAAGWIKGLKLSSDGLWGKVEWTAQARELIASKAYRYLSPSFHFSKQGPVITKLKGAGLVHSPALHLHALASQETQMDNDSFRTRLAELLDIDPQSDEDMIFAAVSALVSGNVAMSELGPDNQPGPSKFVPIGAVQDLMKDRQDWQTTRNKEIAETKVKNAMAQDYISPGMKDWATALCTQDVASFIGSGIRAFVKRTHSGCSSWCGYAWSIASFQFGVCPIGFAA